MTNGRPTASAALHANWGRQDLYNDLPEERIRSHGATGLCTPVCDGSSIGDVFATGAGSAAVCTLDEHGAFTGSVDENVHMTASCSHGVPLIEVIALDELAAAHQHRVLLAATAVTDPGGTASPLAPMAVL